MGFRLIFRFFHPYDSGIIAHMAASSKKVAEAIGHTLAHVQDGADFFIDWGFKALKNIGKEKTAPRQDENRYLRATKKVRKSILLFLGETGDSFYQKYQELKAKK